jgi:uncharacterized protein
MEWTIMSLAYNTNTHCESVELIHRLYDAYARRDAATILANLSPEIDIYQTELLPWGGRYRGHDGAQRFFKKLLEQIDSRVEVREVIPAGSRVVVTGCTRGTVVATGAPFEVRVAHIYTLTNGKVSAVEFYVDTPAMRDALRHA